MSISVETVGRRHYIVGLPYHLRDRAKSAGCRWDADRRAWWSGVAATAEQVVAAAASAPTTAAEKADGPATVVAGRARYTSREGRVSTVYMVGRVDRGRTTYDAAVSPVRSSAGAYRLASRDGARQWWADADRVAVEKSYHRPTTIGGLARYAASVRANGGQDLNACPTCGALDCETAYGRRGLCQED